MANLPQKINQIQDKINNIYKQIQALQAEAKANLKKSQQTKGAAKEMYKQKCLMALKKKKALQNQAKQHNANQNLLQNAVFTVENINGHKEMYQNLKNAVDTQKQAMKNLDIDKLDDLQDQMLDMKMQSNLMNQMMNRNYDMDYDQDQFQDEFMQFQKQVATEKKKIISQPIKQQQQKNSMDIDQFLK